MSIIAAWVLSLYAFS